MRTRDRERLNADWSRRFGMYADRLWETKVRLPGLLGGMTYEQIRNRFPEEHDLRAKDKYNYRYPGGESYSDLVHKLAPIASDLEREKVPAIVIAL